MAKSKKKSRVGLYTNLSKKRRGHKDARARKKAEYLATLPKNPVKRFFYRLHPKRVLRYWFSRRGLLMAAKLAGAAIVLALIVGLSLFAYFRKDLDAIRPSTLSQRVKSTVTKYYDRNGKLLWEDKGTGNYTLVVDSKDIAPCMGRATVAIEDKDFYKHGGVSITGIVRAALNNTRSGNTQGGSTLTQQLVKQVFFRDEASDRGLGGIPRKIKEAILSIEVERMYTKDQILGLYMNESPYGGRRNGVESAAQTYFGKSSKDLNLAECALLAGIPNQPGLYDPYNIAGHEALLARQHKVLDNMVAKGYATKQEAEKAKEIPILDEIKPLSDQLEGIKAPHFVLMVRDQLEQSLGKTVVGEGGLTVTTTLDLDAQEILEQKMNDIFDGTMTGGNCGWTNCSSYIGFSDAAAAVEDIDTGQVLALMGSRDFDYPGFGQDNATTGYLQPASTIKPFVYAQLFQDQGDGKVNYGSGTILPDVKTNFGGGYIPQNVDNKFNGNISIRQALDTSRNIPAIKAMAINERNNPGSTLKLIHDAGNKEYCTHGDEVNVGLSMAIGSCGTRLIDHVNAFSTLARNGVYKPQSTILKVTNSSGQVLQQYKAEGKQVINPEAAYIVSDILSDSRYRAKITGSDYIVQLNRLGIKSAAKTGTSNTTVNGRIIGKEVWTAGYTSKLAMAVWLGNPDSTPLRFGNSLVPAMFFDYTLASMSELYMNQGKLKYSDWFSAPEGIQRINGELYPSYYRKTKNSSGKEMMVFDRVSKKRATDATPSDARIELEVSKVYDPFADKEVITAPDGYDAEHDDDVHSPTDKKPSVSIAVVGSGINVSYSRGTFNPVRIEVSSGGVVIATNSNPSSGQSGSWSLDSSQVAKAVDGTLIVKIIDDGYYTASASANYSTP